MQEGFRTLLAVELTGPDEGHSLTEAFTRKPERSVWEHFFKVKVTVNTSDLLLAVFWNNAAFKNRITSQIEFTALVVVNQVLSSEIILSLLHLSSSGWFSDLSIYLFLVSPRRVRNLHSNLWLQPLSWTSYCPSAFQFVVCHLYV